MKSKSFLYISLAVDLLIAVAKFVAAALTRSSSMLSEGVHSVIDASSQLLLIWGHRTSSRRPDAERPFGYGKELYFWSFIVSLSIFILGGCISFYEGWMQIQQPEKLGSATWNYFILAFSLVFTLISLFSALKEFNKQRGGVAFFEAIIQSKDPSTFIVLLGDVGDVLGLIIAFLGVYFGHRLNNPYYDGLASIAIGVLMILISLLLVRESKSLLMGETTSKKTLRKIVALAEADMAVVKVRRHFSMYMGPEEVILQLNMVFKDDLKTHDITDAIDRITQVIKNEFPRIKQIFIEPVAG
jgi:cation diffusion facilitator family transporter